jgi:hypothetical protein
MWKKTASLEDAGDAVIDDPGDPTPNGWINATGEPINATVIFKISESRFAPCPTKVIANSALLRSGRNND